MDKDHVNITLDRRQWEEDILKLLAIIRPSCDKSHIKIKPMGGSVINNVYHVTLPEPYRACPLVVRINGPIAERYGINRKQEMDIMRMLRNKDPNPIPKLVATFDNGIAYEFFSGAEMSKADATEDTLRKIAHKLAELHAATPPGADNEKCHMEQLITIKTNCIPDCQEITERIPEKLPPKDLILTELNMLLDHMTSLKLPLVVSHNDLWFGNIILNKNTGDTWFIDCERMGYNYAGFDIAHFFVDVAGLEPDEILFKRFIKDYLERLSELSPDGARGRGVTDADVEHMYKLTLKCHLIHMLYGTALYLSLYGQKSSSGDRNLGQKDSSNDGTVGSDVIETACGFYKMYKSKKTEYLSIKF